MIRLTLRVAFRKGHSGSEIRSAVERWLRAAPPERVVIVDPRTETIDLWSLTRSGPPWASPPRAAPWSSWSASRGSPPGALALALPYHAAKVGPRRAGGAARDRPRRAPSAGAPAGRRALPGAHVVLVFQLADPAPDRRGARRGPPRRRAPGRDAAALPARGVAPAAARRRHRLRGRPGRPPCARPARAACASCAFSASRTSRASARRSTWPRPRPSRRTLRLIIPSAAALLLAGAASGFSPRSLWDAWPARRFVPTPRPACATRSSSSGCARSRRVTRAASPWRRWAAPSRAGPSAS